MLDFSWADRTPHWKPDLSVFFFLVITENINTPCSDYSTSFYQITKYDQGLDMKKVYTKCNEIQLISIGSSRPFDCCVHFWANLIVASRNRTVRTFRTRCCFILFIFVLRSLPATVDCGLWLTYFLPFAVALRSPLPAPAVSVCVYTREADRLLCSPPQNRLVCQSVYYKGRGRKIFVILIRVRACVVQLSFAFVAARTTSLSK